MNRTIRAEKGQQKEGTDAHSAPEMASHFHILRYIASFVDQAKMYPAWPPACLGGHTHTKCISRKLAIETGDKLHVENPNATPPAMVPWRLE